MKFFYHFKMVLRLIKKSDTSFRLYYDYIDDPKEGTYAIELDEPDVAIKKIKRGIAQQHIPNIWTTPTYNVFDTTSFEDACAAIEAFLADDTFVFNEAEYTAALARYNGNASNNAKAKLFTCQMSKKYNAFLVLDIPLKYYFEDIDRYELCDPVNKILYKCKYSPTKISMGKDLRYASEFLPEDYKLVLIVNDGAEIAKTVDIEYVKEPFDEPAVEEVDKDAIDDAIEEIDFIARRLIKSGEFDMRVEACRTHEHDDILGDNHVSQYHMLSNKTRRIIQQYSESNYFMSKISSLHDAQRLLAAI